MRTLKSIYTGCIAAAVCGLLAAMPFTAYADTESTEAESFVSADGLYRYGLDENGDAQIYEFMEAATHQGEVVVPSQIDGYDVVYLGNGSFAQATGVTSITLPASVTSIGTCVFMGCTGLEQFIVEEGNPYFIAGEDGILFSDNAGMLECYPPAKADASYTIPDTVDEIGPAAFMYCYNLKEVSIPESVLYIDAWAFSYTGLTDITLPDSLVQIDDYAFAYCTSLHNIAFGEGLQYIYGAAFAGCKALQEVTLPENLLTIGQYAFCDTSMKSVTIPVSVEQIGYCAFGYVSSGTSFSPVDGFTVYGIQNSMAQSYCTSSDDENEYQNNFAFVAIDENGETIPTEATESADTASDSDSSADDSGDASTAEQGGDSGKIALIGGITAGAAVIIVLAVVLIRKITNKKQDDAE